MGKDELYNIKDVLDFQIFSLVKDIKNSPFSYDELYQIAYLGYMKARQNFNPKYGRMSLSYAGKYIQRELLLNLRGEWKVINNTISLPEENAEAFLENILEGVEIGRRNPTDDYRLSIIERLLSKLPKQQAEIIHDFYFAEEPKRLMDLAKEKGISKQRIHQLKQKGLDRLQLLLEIEDGQ